MDLPEFDREFEADGVEPGQTLRLEVVIACTYDSRAGWVRDVERR